MSKIITINAGAVATIDMVISEETTTPMTICFMEKVLNAAMGDFFAAKGDGKIAAAFAEINDKAILQKLAILSSLGY